MILNYQYQPTIRFRRAILIITHPNGKSQCNFHLFQEYNGWMRSTVSLSSDISRRQLLFHNMLATSSVVVSGPSVPTLTDSTEDNDFELLTLTQMLILNWPHGLRIPSQQILNIILTASNSERNPCQDPQGRSDIIRRHCSNMEY